MSAIQQFILYATLVLLLGVLVGLVARKRVSACRFFTAYVAYALVSGTLVMGWPRVFHTSAAWAVGQIVESLLLLGVGLELGYRVFKAFPGARQSAGMLLLVVFVSIGLTVLTAPAPLSHPGGPAWILLALRAVPRLSTGVTWLLTAIGTVILWYRLPLDTVRKAILLGLIPYQLLFTLALAIERSVTYANYAYTSAYFAVVLYWARVIWRSRQPRRPDPGTLALSPPT